MILHRLGQLLIAVLVLMAPAAAAQQASLVADSLRIDGNDGLIAEGNVEVFFQGARLKAGRVTYRRGDDTLLIDGPIRLTDGQGSLLLASSAELDSELTEGILRSARLILEEQLQLAAAEIARSGGRYTRLRRVVASSCEVCGSEAPVWEIRASGVVHDQLERQLYFENAQLRVAGIPVFYIPRLRLPDPTQDRATGLLVPEIRTTSELGTGLKFPYFIRIGDSADLTLTPYLSSATRTLEARYRQVFRRGTLQFDGAFTARDDILEDQSRGYAFVTGRFNLPRAFRLDFNYQYASDPSYLLDYGYSEQDRLQSSVALTRTRDKDNLRFGVIEYETLRASDEGLEDTLPKTVAQLYYTRRLPPTALGGEIWATFDARALTRPSEADISGRDDTRIGAAVDWRRDWQVANGLLVSATAGVAADAYEVDNDSTLLTNPSRLTPRAALTLRWPLERRSGDGIRDLLEPVVQLAWAESYGDEVPNEDSLLVEFDEGNLFALSRFSGSDVYEQGLRANLGVTWTRTWASGMALGVTAGRVVRFSSTDQFEQGTGLDGDLSDWLGAVRLELPGRLSVINRSLFSDSLDFTRNETRLDWVFDRGEISTAYLWAVPEPAENRTDQLSEWSLAAEYDLNRNWRGRVGWRYDFEADRAARAGLGLQFRNECVDVDLSVSRRFTSSTSVQPTTDLNLRVSLSGFGTGNDGREYRRSCSG